MTRTVYPALAVELLARGITRKQVFQRLGNCEGALSRKMHGKTEFTLTEALKIHREFLPGTDFLTVFRRAE